MLGGWCFDGIGVGMEMSSAESCKRYDRVCGKANGRDVEETGANCRMVGRKGKDWVAGCMT